MLDRRFDDIFHNRCYVDADTVAFNERDDRKVGNVDGMVSIDGDHVTVFGYPNLVVLHLAFSPFLM